MSENQYRTSMDTLIEASAARAAREAAVHHAQVARQLETPWGALAIYLWAAFAFMASSLAGATFYANGWTPQHGNRIVAQADRLDPFISVAPSDLMLTASDGPTLAPEAFANRVDTLTTASNIPAQETEIGVLFGGFSGVEAIIPLYEAAQADLKLEMNGINPLVRFRARGSTYEAALVLGPFPDTLRADLFCRATSIACQSTPYAGDPLFDN